AEGFLALVEQAKGDGFGVDGGDGGDADVEVGGAGAEVDASVLRQAFFGDVEARHDFEARDDGVLEAQEVFRHGHGDQQAIDAVADAELAFLGFEVDVGGLVGDGLGDDVGDEAHDGGVLIGVEVGVGVAGGGQEVVVVGVVERAGADAVVFDDELVDAFGGGEVPDEGTGGEGGDPVGHFRGGRPGGGEAKFAGGERVGGWRVVVNRRREGGGGGEGNGLEVGGEPRGEQAEAVEVGGGVELVGEAGGAGELDADGVVGEAEGGG